MRITGGEPLLQQSTWKLFENISKYPLPDLEINTNSNLGMTNRIVKRLSKYVKEFEDENEIKRAIGYFKKFKTPFILLHCVSVYPTPDEETNLLRMVSLSKKFKTQVGFSDHTIGIQASIAAVILGAAVIEKHFTLSKNLVGPDHQLSMDPKEFKSLHDNVKKAQIILGNKSILPSKTEKKTKKIFRRSVTALKNIKKGEKYSKYNICLKRPANGLHPKYLNFLLGKKAKINIKINSKIQKKHFI